MTEVTQESTTEAPQEAPVFPDEMAEMSFKMLSKLTDERNAEVGKINAVKGDRMTLTEQLEASSTNPEAVQAREAKEEAQEALDEAIMALHKVIQPEVDALLKDAESSVTQIEEKVKDLDSKIKPGLAYFKKMYGENLAKHLPAMARLKGFSTRGAGSSGRRIRGYVVSVKVDGETTDFENVASAAKYLDVETSALQEAFFKEAGNPEKLADAPDVVTFSVTYTETYDDNSTEDKTAKVTATRTAKDEGSTEADEDEAATESE
jgi:hypothetical protein